MNSIKQKILLWPLLWTALTFFFDKHCSEIRVVGLHFSKDTTQVCLHSRQVNETAWEWQILFSTKLMTEGVRWQLWITDILAQIWDHFPNPKRHKNHSLIDYSVCRHFSSLQSGNDHTTLRYLETVKCFTKFATNLTTKHEHRVADRFES